MIAQVMVERLPWPTARELLRLMRVDRPIGTWLLLWPSLWALSAASPPGEMPWGWCLLFTLGAFVMRSAGCVINDIADRHIDPHVARTRNRPLARGSVTLRAALWLLAGLLLIALGIALLLPPAAFNLALAGAFLALSYPFTKRFFRAPQLYMGAAFGWGVVMGWATVAGTLTPVTGLIFFATLSWAAGYDTIYAMMDREDDRKLGVRSTALLFGRHARLAIAVLFGITLVLLAVAGDQLGLGLPYHAALAFTLGHMVWQLVAIGHERTDVLLNVFLSNRWIGLVLFLGFWWG